MARKMISVSEEVYKTLMERKPLGMTVSEFLGGLFTPIGEDEPKLRLAAYGLSSAAVGAIIKIPFNSKADKDFDAQYNQVMNHLKNLRRKCSHVFDIAYYEDGFKLTRVK